MKLILVRHGQTDRNIDPHLAGQGETAINAVGEAQAERVAERLRDEHLDVIYSSTMLRARQTAEKIRHTHPQVEYMETPDIRERDSGLTKGWTIAQREAAELKSGLSPRDWRPENGESLRDMKHRAQDWFNRTRVAHQDQTIVAVSHGLFLYALMEVAIENGADVERDDFHHANGAITFLDVPRAGAARILHLADTSHLQKND